MNIHVLGKFHQDNASEVFKFCAENHDNGSKIMLVSSGGEVVWIEYLAQAIKHAKILVIAVQADSSAFDLCLAVDRVEIPKHFICAMTHYSEVSMILADIHKPHTQGWVTYNDALQIQNDEDVEAREILDDSEYELFKSGGNVNFNRYRFAEILRKKGIEVTEYKSR